LEEARAAANAALGQAKKGINPKEALAASATAGGLTVRQFAEKFLQDYVHSKELDSTAKYELAFNTHILPQVGEHLAELVIYVVLLRATAKRPRRLTGCRPGRRALCCGAVVQSAGACAGRAAGAFGYARG
jgi:hypothetical protein